MFLDPFVDPVARATAAEPAKLFAIMKQDHCGKTPQPIVAGKTHVIIHFHLAQPKGAFVLSNHPFQRRSQGNAGGTPLRPEIHQDQTASGGIDNLRLESGFIDIEDIGGFLLHTAARSDGFEKRARIA